MMHKKISRAFISVSDRTGLIELAKKLVEQEVEIIATDGTAAHLKASGIATKSVEQVTGFTQVLDDGLLATVFFLTAFLATVFLAATFLTAVFFAAGFLLVVAFLGVFRGSAMSVIVQPGADPSRWSSCVPLAMVLTRLEPCSPRLQDHTSNGSAWPAGRLV